MKIRITDRIHKHHKGFTLIEMIGVLAVIAILAAILIPKVFEAINSARVNGTAVGIQTVKTAIGDHYGRWGALTKDGSTGTATDIPAAGEARYDLMLLQEGLLEKQFAPKIAANPVDDKGDTVAAAVGTRVELVVGTPVAANGLAGGYWNLTTATSAETAKAGAVAQARLYGISQEDAEALDRVMDGNDGSTLGRVQWPAGTAFPAGPIFVYVTHR